MHNLLIAGAGELGSRYLQGVANFREPLEIWILDPRADSLSRAKSRWMEVDGEETSHSIRWLQKLDDLPNNIDLAIISTSADVRAQVVQSLVRHSVIRYWVLEKLLAQSLHELDVLLEALESAEGVWVNTARRLMSWYQEIGQMIPLGDPVKGMVFGGSWRLGCNAIHFLDVLAWWTNEELISVDSSELELVWTESKRPGFFELNGKLSACYSKGSELTLDSRSSEDPLILKLFFSDSEWIIDEQSGLATNSNGNRIAGKLEYQSEMTGPLLEMIADYGACGLPVLSESVQTHRVYLQAMLDHWNTCHSRNDSFVPIT